MTVGAYDDDIATALELIEEFGQQCVWRKEVVARDPDQPWLGGNQTSDDHQPFIAFIPATDGSSGFGLSKFRQGTDDVAFSTFGLMGAQEFTPEVTDTVLRGGTPLVIAAIDTLQPAEDVVLYILSIV